MWHSNIECAEDRFMIQYDNLQSFLGIVLLLWLHNKLVVIPFADLIFLKKQLSWHMGLYYTAVVWISSQFELIQSWWWQCFSSHLHWAGTSFSAPTQKSNKWNYALTLVFLMEMGPSAELAAVPHICFPHYGLKYIQHAGAIFSSRLKLKGIFNFIYNTNTQVHTVLVITAQHALVIQCMLFNPSDTANGCKFKLNKQRLLWSQ